MPDRADRHAGVAVAVGFDFSDSRRFPRGIQQTSMSGLRNKPELNRLHLCQFAYLLAYGDLQGPLITLEKHELVGEPGKGQFRVVEHLTDLPLNLAVGVPKVLPTDGPLVEQATKSREIAPLGLLIPTKHGRNVLFVSQPMRRWSNAGEQLADSCQFPLFQIETVRVFAL
jgi:hypothetical protein